MYPHEQAYSVIFQKRIAWLSGRRLANPPGEDWLTFSGLKLDRKVADKTGKALAEDARSNSDPLQE